jgi:hypothetical protein
MSGFFLKAAEIKEIAFAVKQINKPLLLYFLLEMEL